MRKKANGKCMSLRQKLKQEDVPDRKQKWKNKEDLNVDIADVPFSLEMPIKIEPAYKKNQREFESSQSQEYVDLQLPLEDEVFYTSKENHQIQFYQENEQDDAPNKKDIIEELLMPLETSQNILSSENQFSYQPLSLGSDFPHSNDNLELIKNKLAKLKRIRKSQQILINNMDVVMNFHHLSKKTQLSKYYSNIYNSLSAQNQKLKENLDIFIQQTETVISYKRIYLSNEDLQRGQESSVNKKLHGTMNSQDKEYLVEKALSQSRIRQKKNKMI